MSGTGTPRTQENLCNQKPEMFLLNQEWSTKGGIWDGHFSKTL